MLQAGVALLGVLSNSGGFRKNSVCYTIYYIVRSNLDVIFYRFKGDEGEQPKQPHFREATVGESCCETLASTRPGAVLRS